MFDHIGVFHVLSVFALTLGLYQARRLLHERPGLVSADGQRFIIADTRASTLPPSLTIVFNWPELLKQSSK